MFSPKLGYFAVIKRLEDAELEPILLSNGDILVLPKNSGYATIKRPKEKLPEYTPEQVNAAIAFVKAFGITTDYPCNNLNLFEETAK